MKQNATTASETDSGVLLHPTSLPGPWGIGTLGSEIDDFISWLSRAGGSVWQILPLSPPVYGASPYQALSSFALNPLLLSPEILHSQGLLTAGELQSAESVNSGTVNWGLMEERKQLILSAAFRALERPSDSFREFSSLSRVRQFGFFAAMKDRNLGRPWHLWKDTAHPPGKSIEVQNMIQFFLEDQWSRVRQLCRQHGIRILGDLPVYSAQDSADVYFNREVFSLLPSGQPRWLAGVPPDYFSSTGQLWGNPVYDWNRSRETGHRWWTARMKRALDLYDMVRIDHFRGFDSFWRIPSGSATAVNGEWVKGPGYSFFAHLERKLGRLPVVAEDLGMITESVTELRKKCGFPGMTVLQFALQDPSFKAEDLPEDTVVYTGTHDNDTTAGWLKNGGKNTGYTSVKEIVSLALDSRAGLAVIPVQDILKLNSEARMNTPGTTRANWSFRLKEIPDDCDLRRNR